MSKRINISHKLLIYGASAGAASLATTAKADIIWSGTTDYTEDPIYFSLQNPGTAPSDSGFSGADFELDKTGIAFENDAAITISPYTGATDSPQFAVGSVNSGTSYALELTAGQTIGSGLNFTGTTSGFLYTSGSNTQGWQQGTGYLGLEIELDGTTDYGWANVSFGGFEGEFIDITLNDWAYENDGDPIIAGAIPEPSVMGLLIAGAAGAVALRRWRRSEPRMES